MVADKGSYSSLSEFYPFYLSQHSNRTCRRLHFIGTTGAIVTLIYVIVFQEWSKIIYTLLSGMTFLVCVQNLNLSRVWLRMGRSFLL